MKKIFIIMLSLGLTIGIGAGVIIDMIINPKKEQEQEQEEEPKKEGIAQEVVDGAKSADFLSVYHVNQKVYDLRNEPTYCDSLDPEDPSLSPGILKDAPYLGAVLFNGALNVFLKDIISSDKMIVEDAITPIDEVSKTWSFAKDANQKYYMTKIVNVDQTDELGADVKWNFANGPMIDIRTSYSNHYVSVADGRPVTDNVHNRTVQSDSSVTSAITDYDANGIPSYWIMKYEIVMNKYLFRALSDEKLVVDLTTGQSAEFDSSKDAWVTCSGQDTLDETDDITINLMNEYNKWADNTYYHEDLKKKISDTTLTDDEIKNFIGVETLNRKPIDYKNSIVKSIEDYKANK